MFITCVSTKMLLRCNKCFVVCLFFCFVSQHVFYDNKDNSDITIFFNPFFSFLFSHACCCCSCSCSVIVLTTPVAHVHLITSSSFSRPPHLLFLFFTKSAKITEAVSSSCPFELKEDSMFNS